MSAAPAPRSTSARAAELARVFGEPAFTVDWLVRSQRRGFSFEEPAEYSSAPAVQKKLAALIDDASLQCAAGASAAQRSAQRFLDCEVYLDHEKLKENSKGRVLEFHELMYADSAKGSLFSSPPRRLAAVARYFTVSGNARHRQLFDQYAETQQTVDSVARGETRIRTLAAFTALRDSIASFSLVEKLDLKAIAANSAAGWRTVLNAPAFALLVELTRQVVGITMTYIGALTEAITEAIKSGVNNPGYAPDEMGSKIDFPKFLSRLDALPLTSGEVDTAWANRLYAKLAAGAPAVGGAWAVLRGARPALFGDDFWVLADLLDAVKQFRPNRKSGNAFTDNRYTAVLGVEVPVLMELFGNDVVVGPLVVPPLAVPPGGARSQRAMFGVLAEAVRRDAPAPPPRPAPAPAAASVVPTQAPRWHPPPLHMPIESSNNKEVDDCTYNQKLSNTAFNEAKIDFDSFITRCKSLISKSPEFKRQRLNCMIALGVASEIVRGEIATTYGTSPYIKTFNDLKIDDHGERVARTVIAKFDPNNIRYEYLNRVCRLFYIDYWSRERISEVTEKCGSTIISEGYSIFTDGNAKQIDSIYPTIFANIDNLSALFDDFRTPMNFLLNHALPTLVWAELCVNVGMQVRLKSGMLRSDGIFSVDVFATRYSLMGFKRKMSHSIEQYFPTSYLKFGATFTLDPFSELKWASFDSYQLLELNRLARRQLVALGDNSGVPLTPQVADRIAKILYRSKFIASPYYVLDQAEAVVGHSLAEVGARVRPVQVLLDEVVQQFADASNNLDALALDLHALEVADQYFAEYRPQLMRTVYESMHHRNPLPLRTVVEFVGRVACCTAELSAALLRRRESSSYAEPIRGELDPTVDGPGAARTLITVFGAPASPSGNEPLWQKFTNLPYLEPVADSFMGLYIKNNGCDGAALLGCTAWLLGLRNAPQGTPFNDHAPQFDFKSIIF